MAKYDNDKASRPTTRSGPPHRGDALAAIVRTGTPAPEEPTELHQAVNWYTRLFEQPDQQFERPSEHSLKGEDNSVGWRDPYVSRMRDLIQRFRAAPVELRELVIAARREKMYWRGEERGMFQYVMMAYESMRESEKAHGKAQARRHMMSQARRDILEIGK